MNSCAAFRSTRSFSTVTVVFLLTSTILALSTRCHAQVTKLNTDDLMDIVFDMKKAASTADKFAADGSKYCHWGLVSLDASDLDLVVSRFLLNRGSVVPADISASKMWHVDFIAGDLINQLEMGLQECNVGVRINSGARDVAVASKPVLLKFIDARQRFDRLAYEQTAWQERKRAMPGDGDENLRVPAVDASDILGASLEVREAWESANKAILKAATTKECSRFDSSGLAEEPVEMNKLIDRLSRLTRAGSYNLPAADMWLAAMTAENQKFTLLLPLEACAYYSLDKKKAAKVATESLDSYHRLRAALAKFNALALKQTEWEEQVVQKQTII